MLSVGVCHEESIEFLVLEHSTSDLILGRPWLIRHDPIISWATGEVLRWGQSCFQRCIPDPPTIRSITSPVSILTTSIESPHSHLPRPIPIQYAEFQDVFCPLRASQLPPHRAWDCAIDLTPDAKLPKGKIYSLSLPEQHAMKEYIQEALQQGYIRPSKSPAASSWQKKMEAFVPVSITEHSTKSR